MTIRGFREIDQNDKRPCVRGPLDSRFVDQQKIDRKLSPGHRRAMSAFHPHFLRARLLPSALRTLASRCVFLSAYTLCDWKRSLLNEADSVWVHRVLAWDRRRRLYHWLRSQGAVALRSRGACQIYITNRTLTGRMFLRLSNGVVARLTADKTPSSRCVLTGKMFRATTCSL